MIEAFYNVLGLYAVGFLFNWIVSGTGVLYSMRGMIDNVPFYRIIHSVFFMAVFKDQKIRSIIFGSIFHTPTVILGVFQILKKGRRSE